MKSEWQRNAWGVVVTLALLWPAQLLAAEPALSINDVSVSSVSGSAVLAVFTVTLSAPSTRPVAVSFATEASAGEAVELEPARGVVRIPAGETSARIRIVVQPSEGQADRHFRVVISSKDFPVTDGVATGTVLSAGGER